MIDTRALAAIEWLERVTVSKLSFFSSVSGDASFRRYFRVGFDEGPTRILMDSPPKKEDCRPFIAVADILRNAGARVPEIVAQDLDEGYLLLSDLGDKTFLDALTPEIDYGLADRLMISAIDSLISIQKSAKTDGLPRYDSALLHRELDLFADWCLSTHCRLVLTDAEKGTLDRVFSQILDQVLSQPTVFCHRDYMVRNLMVPDKSGDDPRPGVLDFQDAVVGPIAYDCASLFADAFVSFDEELTLDWLIRYREKAQRAGLPVGEDIAAFHRDYEWAGLHRHLKVLGIFCRLNHRDGKSRYLTELPRFSGYVRRTCKRYDVLRPLLPILDRAEERIAQINDGQAQA